MGVAQAIALLGTCDRKQVGAVIVRDGRCISWGYNGAPPGMPHCDEVMHGWKGKGLYESEDDTEEEMRKADMAAAEHLGCINATHAEANALAFAAKQGISTDKAELFVTVSPCESCARLLIAAGIQRVYYFEEYRLEDGTELLRRASIECLQIG